MQQTESKMNMLNLFCLHLLNLILSSGYYGYYPLTAALVRWAGEHPEGLPDRETLAVALGERNAPALELVRETFRVSDSGASLPAWLVDHMRASVEAGREGGAPIVALERGPAGTGFVSPGIIDMTGVDGVPDVEHFGPLLQVYRYADLDEAFAVADDTAFGLSAGILATDRALFERLLDESRAGVVNWNRPLTGASSAAPFGGVGASGNHRPSAYYAADYCAWPMASLEAGKSELPESLAPGLNFD